jgi:hypothetical protein
MKFKFIFILFNLIIVLSFLAIYFMPLIMLGWDYTKVFWGRNWGLPLFFIGVIGLLNAYFILNWKVFTLLEREDWPALITHLEHRIYEKKLIFSQQVKILINAYLVRSELDAIGKLEDFIRDRKPKLLPRSALAFGIPHLLRNDSKLMERYFSQFIHIRGRDGAWVRWNYAFALILKGEKEESEVVLAGVCAEKTEPVLSLLSIYLLHSLKPAPGRAALVEKGRIRIKGRYTQNQWAREVERSKSSVQIVILQKLIEEATGWLFAESDGGDQTEETAIH